MKLFPDISRIILLFLLAVLPDPVHAFQARTEPAKIAPGDPFLVKVTGVKDSRPEAWFNGRTFGLVSCGKGCFMGIAAADMKAKPGRHRVLVTAGAKKKRLSITIQRPAFRVIRLTLPSDKVTLSAEDTERVVKEERLLKALWAERSERIWEGGFVLPLHTELSTAYGVKRIINGEKESIHAGIDLRGESGDEVMASNSGRVVLAEELFFGGNTLVLDHGMGIYTVYMHLSGFQKRPGDDVARGEIIGFVGSTGRSTGPHLHFGVKVQDVSVNPVSVTKMKL